MRRTSLHALFTAALVLAATACGGLHYKVPATPKAAGADVDITADVNEDANITRLNIQVANLAPAARLSDGATEFVVWSRKDDDAKWTRVGALSYDEGDRIGALAEASVPEASFDLVITVEKDASPESPSAEAIVSQRVED